MTKVLVYLASPILLLLCRHNIKLRNAGLLPDEWYWADKLLCDNGILWRFRN